MDHHSAKSHSLGLSQLKKVLATSQFRAINKKDEQARYLRTLNFSFRMIGKGISEPPTSIQRWCKSNNPRTGRGRPSLLTPKQDETLQEEVIKAAKAQHAMTRVELRQKVRFFCGENLLLTSFLSGSRNNGPKQGPPH